MKKVLPEHVDVVQLVYGFIFGSAARCPDCRGELAPAFGETVSDDGVRRAVLDPTTAICRDCGEMFTVPEK